MQYDFDERVCRQGTNSYKWDSPDAEGAKYPLWVADMDFRAAEPITRALHQRLDHSVFGYVTTPSSLRRAITSWFSRRHGWKFRAEQISLAPGVVPALVAILNHLNRHRQQPLRVLLNSPAYNCFYSCIEHTECELVESRLIDHEGRYEYDWEDMAAKMAEADVFLLCSPHNPTGRVWTRDELSHIAELAAQHQVLVIADEIHCEFAWHHNHIPYATIASSNRYIILTSATKAFNIAGLQCAGIVSGDEEAKSIVDSALEATHLEDVNCMGVVAAEAAYNECEDWIDQFNEYIKGNYTEVLRFYAENMPDFRVTRMDGTYLAWVRLPKGTNDVAYCREVLKKTGVKVNPGSMYGDAHYVRINMACSRSFLLEALNLLSAL